MGKASVTIAISGEYNSRAAERAQRSLEKLAIQAAATNDSMYSGMVKAGGKLAEVGGTIYGFGSKAERLGETLTKSVTVPLVGMATASVEAFKAVDAGSDIAIAATGKTGAAAEALDATVQKVAAEAPGDFETVGTAVGLVESRLHLADDAAESTSKTFLEFSKVTGMDVSGAITDVGKTLDQFGLSTDQADGYLGLLLTTSQNTGVSVSTLADDVQNNAATFEEMGVPLGGAVDLLGRFEAAGLNSDQMLTGLKKAAVTFSAKGEDMATGLSDLISRLQDSSTAAEATQEAYDIFGKKAGLAFVEAAKQGQISVDDLSASLGDYSGVVDQTYQATKDGTDEIEEAWKQVQESAADVGKVIADDLAPYAKQAADWLKGLADKFNGLSSQEQTHILKLVGIAAAAGPVITVMGKLTKGVGNVFTVLGKGVQAFGVYKDASSTTSEAMQKLYAKSGSLASSLGLQRNSALKAAGGVESLTDADGAAITSTTKLDKIATIAKGSLVALAMVGVAVLVAEVAKAVKEQQDLDKATSGVTKSISNLASPVNASKDAYDSLKSSGDGAAKSMEDVRKEVENTVSAQADMADTISQRTDDYRTSAGMLEEYRQTIDKYANTSGLTADQQAQLEIAVKGVNDQCGTQYKIVDAANGVIADQDGTVQNLTGSIDALIQKKEEELKLEALSEDYKDFYKKQYDAEQTLADATSHYNDTLKENHNQMELRKTGSDQATRDQAAAKQAMQEAQTALDGVNTNIGRVSGSMVQAQTEMDAATTSTQADTDAMASAIQGLSDSGAIDLEAMGTDANSMATQLEAAGITSSTLNSYGSANLADLAANCNGDVGLMVSKLSEWNNAQMQDKYASVHVNFGDVSNALEKIAQLNNTHLDDKSSTVYTYYMNKTLSNASGGIFEQHADGGVILDRATNIGTDAHGVTHIAGEAGAEWVLHAGGMTSVVPLTNSKYVRPFAQAVAREMPASAGSGSSGARSTVVYQTFNQRFDSGQQDPYVLAAINNRNAFRLAGAM